MDIYTPKNAHEIHAQKINEGLTGCLKPSHRTFFTTTLRSNGVSLVLTWEFKLLLSKSSFMTPRNSLRQRCLKKIISSTSFLMHSDTFSNVGNIDPCGETLIVLGTSTCVHWLLTLWHFSKPRPLNMIVANITRQSMLQTLFGLLYLFQWYL